MFPLKPFLDRVVIEVIPIEKIFEQSDVQIPLDDTRSTVRSDRGIVRAVGDGVAMAGIFVEMPVEVGDVVQFDPDYGYAGLLYVNPADKYKRDVPTYLELRVGDLLGRGLRAHELAGIPELVG